ncbi:MAG TPA: PRD domain-containing protein [Bacillaceae bacterium]
MNLEHLKERLSILKEGSAISARAAETTIMAFEHLAVQLNKEGITQSEMLFTHLPVALTRIEKGESVEAPHEGLLKEVEQAPEASMAKQFIRHVEGLWGGPLPKEETDFLLIHYTTILRLNKGGDGE